ncbi:MAG: type II restriction endonuclease [Daejeonella sp.]|uniref:type II restriction endonuclease n=1 Tax=Daejeonella sp. TaxID=2805397 RepID=UPI003C764B5C
MGKSLSEYFSGVGVKRLSLVEVDKAISNQHELNGITPFKTIFGTERIEFKTKFIFLSDNEDHLRESDGHLTWYDSREDHVTRSEFRLYYSDNQVIPLSSSGDLIVVGRLSNNTALVVVAEKGSTIETQLLWLFGFEEVENRFLVKDFSKNHADIGYAGRYIFSYLGIDVEETAPDFLDEIIRRFGETFPSTKEFSEFARSTVIDVSPVEEPDRTLIRWLEREELLFKTLEKQIVAKKLNLGFGESKFDVDDFISFSLSVQNRRKSRAGHSFENNLAVIFQNNNIDFSKGAVTERNNKPDFLFPGKKQYHSGAFDAILLTMLGVKTTAKDRWRQILSEAERIPNKHLITLEPAISKNQTEEMIANNVQLVVPESLRGTYQPAQRGGILSLADFINVVRTKQRIA